MVGGPELQLLVVHYTEVTPNRRQQSASSTCIFSSLHGLTNCVAKTKASKAFKLVIWKKDHRFATSCIWHCTLYRTGNPVWKNEAKMNMTKQLRIIKLYPSKGAPVICNLWTASSWCWRSVSIQFLHPRIFNMSFW